MNLDDHTAFSQLDPRNLMAEIASLPGQLTAAWDFSQSLELPPWKNVQRVVIAGMGTSALAADLLAAYVTPTCSQPVTVVRNYTLSAWAAGTETLVICTSYSGNTEEVLSVYEQAVDRGCRVLAVTSGGELTTKAQKSSSTLWAFEPHRQADAAVGYIFGLLLAAFAHLDLIPDPAEDLVGAVTALRVQQTTLGVDVPIMQNEAKRLAGQCVGRWVALFGSDYLEPVARYWKNRINKLAKTGAQYETLPEADHNALLGVLNPAKMIGNTMLIFLRGRDCHPRNQLRTETTKEYFMLEGLGTDFFNAKGETRLAQMLTALHFGDYLAYYLAMAYDTGIKPQEIIEAFKMYLAETE